ncbi:hypothetical protein D9M71_229950 [compost metagenome]
MWPLSARVQTREFFAARGAVTPVSRSVFEPDLLVNLIDFQFQSISHGDKQRLTQAQGRTQ